MSDEVAYIEFKVKMKLRAEPGFVSVDSGSPGEALFVHRDVAAKNVIVDGWNVLSNLVNGTNPVFYTVDDYEVTE